MVKTSFFKSIFAVRYFMHGLRLDSFDLSLLQLRLEIYIDLKSWNSLKERCVFIYLN